MEQQKFDLGEVLQDVVSGFVGVALARTDYFTECTHYGLCSRSLHDGKPIDWEWFDETRLSRVAGAERIERGSRTPTSGSFPSAPQM